MGIDIRDHGGSFGGGKYRKGSEVVLSEPLLRIYAANAQDVMAIEENGDHYISDGNNGILKNNKNGTRLWTYQPTYFQGPANAVIVGDWIIGSYRNTNSYVMFYKVKRDGTGGSGYFPSAFFSTYAGNTLMISDGTYVIEVHWGSQYGTFGCYTVNQTTGDLTQLWYADSLSYPNLYNQKFVPGKGAFAAFEGGKVVLKSVLTGATLWTIPPTPSLMYHFVDPITGDVYYTTGSGGSTFMNKILYGGTSAIWSVAIQYGYICGGNSKGVIATPYPGLANKPVMTKFDKNGNIIWTANTTTQLMMPIHTKGIESLANKPSSGTLPAIEYIEKIIIEN